MIAGEGAISTFYSIVRESRMAPSQNRQGMDMVLKELTVSIGSRSILKNVSGLAKPGEILAIMGPSGMKNKKVFRLY